MHERDINERTAKQHLTMKVAKSLCICTYVLAQQTNTHPREGRRATGRVAAVCGGIVRVE